MIMKVVGKIRQRLFRGYFRLRSNIHVHHWRGHGIHSPFMYGIVRNVFMKSRVVGPDRRLYEVLRRDGIEQKQAVKIQNLYTHCRMNGFLTIASGECLNRIAPDQLCILLPGTSLETIATTARRVSECHATLILLSPHRNARCWRFAQQIWRHYPCVSVDRRVMVLYFFSSKFQPQHYRI